MSYQLTFRPMTIEDVPKLKLEEKWMYDRFRNYFECKTGPAIIIEEEGRALCAFGGLFEWGRNEELRIENLEYRKQHTKYDRRDTNTGRACEVWFNIIEKKRILNIVRILKRMIVKLAERYEVKRMQAIVRCDSEINNRFMRFMGFVNETPFGMMHKLHNGQSAYLYSRCF